MLTAVNEVFELVATVLCINYLYRKRYYFSFIDVLFLMSELIMLESINHFGFEPLFLLQAMQLFLYIQRLNSEKITRRRLLILYYI